MLSGDELAEIFRVIHRCRPDLTLAEVRESFDEPCLARWLARIAALDRSRSIHWTSSAREGLAWYLERLKIGAGDEVLMPALICEVIADVVAETGATAAVYGVTGEGFQPDVGSCARLISPATKVVVVPHLYGIPAELESFRRLCDAHGLLLVEDCAPCVTGENVGSVGDCGIVSFNYDKPLGLGWGGAVILSERMRNQIGVPEFPELSEVDDEAVAASFVLEHSLTDSAEYRSFLGIESVLQLTLHDAALSRAVLSSFVTGAEESELACLWPGSRRDSAADRLGQMVPKAARAVQRLGREARRLLSRYNGQTSKPRLPLAGRSPISNGWGMRILSAQARSFLREDRVQHRRRILSVYRRELDASKYVVPRWDDDLVPYWLRFPISHRRPTTELRSGVRALSADLGVEVGPYNWPSPIHHIARFRGIRVASDISITEERVAGLLNLPTHGQMTETKARELCSALNRL